MMESFVIVVATASLAVSWLPVVVGDASVANALLKDQIGAWCKLEVDPNDTAPDLSIETLDTSNVTDMTGLFLGCENSGKLVNQERMIIDLSKWDVSKVVSMKEMFLGYDQDVKMGGLWDISKVRDMSNMFTKTTLQYYRLYMRLEATVLWDTTNVEKMFTEKQACPPGILETYPLVRQGTVTARCSGWTNPCDATNVDTACHGHGECSEYDFVHNSLPEYKCKCFNGWFDKLDCAGDRDDEVYYYQDLLDFLKSKCKVKIENSAAVIGFATGEDAFTDEDYDEIENYDTSKVTDFTGVISTKVEHCMTRRVLNLNKWDTRKVTSMQETFFRSNMSRYNISEWDTSAVENFEKTFFGSASLFGVPFTQLGKWDTSSATNMAEMFGVFPNFNGDISHFDVSRVVSMDNIFYGPSHSGTVEDYAINPNYTAFWNTTSVKSYGIRGSPVVCPSGYPMVALSGTVYERCQGFDKAEFCNTKTNDTSEWKYIPGLKECEDDVKCAPYDYVRNVPGTCTRSGTSSSHQASTTTVTSSLSDDTSPQKTTTASPSTTGLSEPSPTGSLPTTGYSSNAKTTPAATQDKPTMNSASSRLAPTGLILVSIVVTIVCCLVIAPKPFHS